MKMTSICLNLAMLFALSAAALGQATLTRVNGRVTDGKQPVVDPSFSDQRISSGAPGTLSTFCGVSAFRSHTTTVLPKCFIASPSPTSSPRLRM